MAPNRFEHLLTLVAPIIQKKNYQISRAYFCTPKASHSHSVTSQQGNHWISVTASGKLLLAKLWPKLKIGWAYHQDWGYVELSSLYWSCRWEAY